MSESENRSLKRASGKSIGVTETNPESLELSEIVLDNTSECDSDYYDDEYYDEYDLDSRAQGVGLPRRRHDLKHGKIITNRGSNQEKFIPTRPKALVKYGKCDVPDPTYDIDEESQRILNDTVHKYHYFASVNGAIRSGERSVLFHCSGHKPQDGSKPQEFLIKVYKLKFGIKRIEKWTMNEYVSTYYYMSRHVNVPNIYCPNRNVLIMNFIGDDGKPAPSLNEVTFEITDKIYTDVITSMYKLYHDAKYVHGRLSARTVLWWRDKLYFISLSGSVETSHPKALELLMKDCCNVTHFFKSKGLLKVKSIMKLFKFITGLKQPDPGVLLALKHNRRPIKLSNISRRRNYLRTLFECPKHLIWCAEIQENV